MQKLCAYVLYTLICLQVRALELLSGCNISVNFLYLLDETWYAGNFEVISLDCDTKCSNQIDADVAWNIHLFSENYNITVSCHNDSCTSINENTKLLNIEQDFTMENTTLEFYHDFIYQDSLVGCIVTADNCTDNHFWVINNPGSYYT